MSEGTLGRGRFILGVGDGDGVSRIQPSPRLPAVALHSICLRRVWVGASRFETPSTTNRESRSTIDDYVLESPVQGLG